MKQQKVQNNVLMLTKMFPEVKNNYNTLVSLYWKEIEGARTFEDVKHCTSSESITRAFRKLVESSEVQVDGKIQQIRMDLEDDFREFYR